MTEETKTKERFLVQETDKRLANYFRPFGIKYSSCLPDNTEQNFFDLNQHCADLIGCAGAWAPLLLEFKVHYEGELPSFKETQHAGLVVLNKFGIPVEYCFNKAPPPSSSTDDEFLGNLLVCDALPLPGKKPVLTHDTLLRRLQDLRTGAPPALTPLAICDSNLFETQQVSQLNTARLLILAGKTAKNLSIDEGRALVKELLTKRKWTGNKNVRSLQRNLDKLSKSRDQLLQKMSAAGWGPAQPSSTAGPSELGETRDEEKPPGKKLRSI
ncbi:hypothetical protein [Ralstonia solanacearum]|uniref:Uncharacterized protein n=1 Tax=Ralstonia solanacearum TaxID=305 RepID=A0AAE3NHM2_RALSL|nr:hypothetical protein [Ralstonia solanacearum]MBB6584608.1 hypothetical protein [Ralstonia solanacearum]MDB0521718.1 hypothetical protein [Ralstonia solanacearum]